LLVRIALELNNSKMGLIASLSLPLKKLVAFKNNRLARSGNTLSAGIMNENTCFGYMKLKGVFSYFYMAYIDRTESSLRKVSSHNECVQQNKFYVDKAINTQ